MAEKRDWSVTASANNGTSVAGFMKEGIAYSEVNDAYREGQAIAARYLADTNGSIVAAGSSSSYILAINQTLTSYSDGDIFAFQANVKNAGATTLRVRTPDGASLSDRPVVKTNLAALEEGDIVAGGVYRALYRSASANFQIEGVPMLPESGNFGGDVSVSGSLAVTGPAAFGGDVSVSSSLVVAGPTEFGGDVSVSGALVVAGTTGLGGAVSVGGSLAVAGATEFGGDVSVSGSLVVVGTTGLGGAVTISGSLAVTGPTALGGDVSASGHLSVRSLSIGVGGAELTIASGVVTVTNSFHRIDTESDAASDDLDTINFSGDNFTLLVIQPEDTDRTVVVKDGTGNLNIAGDFTMDGVNDVMLLMWFGSGWKEISRSSN